MPLHGKLELVKVSGTSIPNPFLLHPAQIIRLQEEGAPEG